MGGKSMEDDERAEEPALCHQKMIRPNTCRSSLLINKIREAVADHRANGINDGLTHASQSLSLQTMSRRKALRDLRRIPDIETKHGGLRN
jgi:hypothetical protein